MADPPSHVRSKWTETCNTSELGVALHGVAIGARSNFKIFLRIRKIMMMHSNEREECCPHTLVDQKWKR